MVLEKINYLVDCVTSDIICFLIKDRGITRDEAMDILYNSKTYHLLCNFETHMYRESSSYVYEWLKEELKGSKQ